jgi:dethiobiotin synthetase
MGKALFITGTGTDVGKSSLSLAVLLWARNRGLRAAYAKPVQCGFSDFGNPPVRGGDADWIGLLSGSAQSAHVTYKLRMPASPHLAAEREGLALDPDRIRRDLESLAQGSAFLVVEGAGGAAVPLNRRGDSLASVAASMSMPCLIACAPGLGTLHHTLATQAYLKSVSAPIAGFAFCHREAGIPETCEDNLRTLEALTGLPFFGALPYSGKIAMAEPLSGEEASAWIAPLAASLDAWWNRAGA